MRPVVVDVARKLTRETEVGGLAAARRHARATGDRRAAQAAGPVRVAGGVPAGAVAGRRCPESYAWIPFGGGVRRCIGASFAQVEMRTVLREVLRRVRLRAPSSRPERGVIRHVTVVPGRGARALVDRAPSRRAGGGTRRRPRRPRRRRARAGPGRRRTSRLTARPGPGPPPRARRCRRRRRSRPRRVANMTLTPSPSSSNGFPSNTTVTSSPPRVANSPSSATSPRIAPGRSRHQPVGRDPITFMPSTIQRVISGAAGTAGWLPTSRSPAPSCRASRRPALSSLVALAIAPNMIEAPKNTTSVHRIVFRSTGRHDTRG